MRPRNWLVAIRTGCGCSPRSRCRTPGLCGRTGPHGKGSGCRGRVGNGYTNIGDENTARYLDESPVDPFWARVNELDVPVYLHPRVPPPNQQRMYQGYEGLLGSAWGFGVETSTHALRLILSGLFDRYPNVNVILGHLGEALPFALPRQHLTR